MLIFSKELRATKSITVKGFSMFYTNNKQLIFLLSVILFHINVFTSEAPKTPPTSAQRSASPVPIEPPSPTLTVAYQEEKMEGERSEKKRKFEQEEADEQEATSRSKRQKREDERPQQQPATAPVAAPIAPEASQVEMLFTLGNNYYNGEHGYRQDKNFAMQLWQEAARLGHKHAAKMLENLKKQAIAPIAAPAQEPTLAMLAELEKTAFAGNPQAQNDLARRYSYGIGVAKDLKKAFDLYTLAANQEYAPAQNNLGTLYKNGIGVEKDLKKAFDLYTLAANQGYAPAQNNLGTLYENGIGVEKDLKKAFDLYTLAANQGYAPAQNNLGTLYANGIGVEKDLKKAFDLYTLAANQGYARAQTNLGILYANGIGIAKDLKKAAELYEPAAKQGNATAQYNLGLLYEYGNGVAKDLKKAAELFEKAANQGHARAQIALKRLQGQTATSSSSSSSTTTQMLTTQELEAAQALGNISAMQIESSATLKSATQAPKAQKSVAGEIAQALLAAQGNNKSAAARILQISSGTVTNLVNGEAKKSTQDGVVELFKKARAAGTLTSKWGLNEEMIKRLNELVGND
jgi:TPR repeat protein